MHRVLAVSIPVCENIFSHETGACLVFAREHHVTDVKGSQEAVCSVYTCVCLYVRIGC